MKKKLILALAALLLLCSCLASCNDSEEGPVVSNENCVFAPDVSPTLIFSTDLAKEYQNTIYRAVKEATGEAPLYGYDDYYDPSDHEIVIGKTSRAISAKAYRKLRLLQKNTDYDVSFVIYASGNSLAIAFDEDAMGINPEVALNYLVDNYIKDRERLELAPGVVYSTTYSTLTYAEEIDAKHEAERWKALEDYISENYGAALAAEMVSAFRYHYALYDSEMVLWLANLYEPYICHCGECPTGSLSCGGGGFYYSNSARDNLGFLPDVESTAQALGAISGLGMTQTTGGGYASILPTWMKQQIVVFLRSIQDEDGYFRHPQWAENYASGQYASRLARDLGNGLSVLSSLGSGPRYNTSTGVKGDNGPVIPKEYLTGTISMGSSVASNVSKVVPSAGIVDWLKDLDSLKAYLDSLYTPGKDTQFYSIGNTMTSQMSQIIAQDKALNTFKTPDSMVAYVVEWFNMHQQRVQDERAAMGLEPNGLWNPTTNYNAVNGLLKISGVYNSAAAAMPYAKEAAIAAIDAITSDEKLGAGVDLYNTWFAVNGVLNNLNTYGGEQGKADAAQILVDLYAISPNAIRVSADKMAQFEKTDHSFSYTPTTSSATSQGMPAAVSGSIEGDVNGNVIASSGHIANVYNALDIPDKVRPPIFGYKELVMFVTELNKLGPVLKHVDEIAEETYPFDFDLDTVGEPPESVSAGGTSVIIEDPRSGVDGNVLHFVSKSGSGDSVTVRNEGIQDGNMQVFEGEFCVNATGTSSGYVMQIFMDQDAMLAIKIEGSKVVVYESTTSSDSTSVYLVLAKFAFDEWFKIRTEHFTGPKGSVRNKIYINDVLVAITDSYYGETKAGTDSGPKNAKLRHTQIYVMMSANVSVYLDNLHCYTAKQNYLVPTEGVDNLVENVDKDVVVAPAE